VSVQQDINFLYNIPITGFLTFGFKNITKRSAMHCLT